MAGSEIPSNRDSAPDISLANPEPMQAQTLNILDHWRATFNGPAFEMEWFHPEELVLDRKKVLVAPSGVYWATGEEKQRPVAGSRAQAVNNVIEAIEEGSFTFGGEQLAQAIFRQCHYDAIYQLR